MAFLTGACSAALFFFEISYPLLKKTTGMRLKIKTHVRVGIFAVIAAFLHWIVVGFSFNLSLGFLTLVLFALSVVSGTSIMCLSRYVNVKTLKYLHIVLSAVTAISMVFHILQEIINLLLR